MVYKIPCKDTNFFLYYKEFLCNFYVTEQHKRLFCYSCYSATVKNLLIKGQEIALY